MKNLSCIECIGNVCKQEIHCHHATQCFQAHLITSSGEETFSRGCIENSDKVPFICATSYKTQSELYEVKCCQKNLCNNETFSQIYPFSAGPSSEAAPSYLIYIIACVVGGLGLLIAAVFLFARLYYNKRNSKYSKCFVKETLNPNVYRDELRYTGDSSLREVYSESLTSGSGSGLPLFVQRTLAKSISLDNMIGKGRYGEVWKGIWQGETVAVKIFFTRDESSWARETEIYSTVVIRHENILGFYGSDMTSNTSCTQLWLVTHFHPRGSLRDYISCHTFNYEELFSACLSIVNGLVFLHTEIMGNQGKPAIAHRDINSKNILIKDDGTCCIADLGLAVLRDPETGEINSGNSCRTGTKRYMSPENLNQSLNCDNFESYRKADIYSLSIVLWEAMTRCNYNGHVSEYKLPYAEHFPLDPPYEEIRDAVCNKNLRPSIPDDWKNDLVLSALTSIIVECWHYDPDIRLSALRIKKNVTKIASDENIIFLS